MLFTTNHTINITRLNTASDIRIWTAVESDVPVYINQSQEDLVQGFDNDAVGFLHKMLTDGNHVDIFIGDRITDENSVQYEVRGKSIFDDMTGVHHQYLLLVAKT